MASYSKVRTVSAIDFDAWEKRDISLESSPAQGASSRAMHKPMRELLQS